ncbi:fimbrial protein [Citrobacter sp. BDA59-3]|uniref:fimbrial protein n=1 Tax=Citrobacter sp. BDA59-3 TaxID=2781952 RepID=UPI0018806454|nr:fimbrial protein [Citrobacter sp. BDA59-3]QOV67342.1 type 1 fimbrial protein [Citrobacter sp. BDA59-3]
MFNKNIFLQILALILLATIKNVQAGCAFAPASTTAKDFTIPLDGRSFSVPPNVAVGYVISRQWVSMTTGDITRTVTCTSAPVYEFRQFGAGTLTLAEGFTDVYKTNLSGIGFRVVATRIGDPSYPMSFQTTSGASSTVTTNLVQSFNLEFVKTAETTAAGYVQANSLPVIEHALGQQSSKVVFARFQMSGQFLINVPTCNILPASASMVVPMGNQKVSDFNGIGSGTGWKNASIQLTGCQQFFGNKNPGSSNSSSVYQSGNMIPFSLTPNSLSLTLSPRNGTIKPIDGIMKIDNETGQATGIGIQLSTSQNESNKINLNAPVNQYLNQSAGITNITVPLYARYIQTESSIGAGKANGRLEYTITYQ